MSPVWAVGLEAAGLLSLTTLMWRGGQYMANDPWGGFLLGWTVTFLAVIPAIRSIIVYVQLGSHPLQLVVAAIAGLAVSALIWWYYRRLSAARDRGEHPKPES